MRKPAGPKGGTTKKPAANVRPTGQKPKVVEEPTRNQWKATTGIKLPGNYKVKKYEIGDARSSRTAKAEVTEWLRAKCNVLRIPCDL